MKFAPARKFGDFFIENGHQLQYFMNFFKIDIFKKSLVTGFLAPER